MIDIPTIIKFFPQIASLVAIIGGGFALWKKIFPTENEHLSKRIFLLKKLTCNLEEDNTFKNVHKAYKQDLLDLHNKMCFGRKTNDIHSNFLILAKSKLGLSAEETKALARVTINKGKNIHYTSFSFKLCLTLLLLFIISASAYIWLIHIEVFDHLFFLWFTFFLFSLGCTALFGVQLVATLVQATEGTLVFRKLLQKGILEKSNHFSFK